MERFDRLTRALSLRLIARRALERWQRLSALSANPFIGEVPRKAASGEATTALEQPPPKDDEPGSTAQASGPS